MREREIFRALDIQVLEGDMMGTGGVHQEGQGGGFHVLLAQKAFTVRALSAMWAFVFAPFLVRWHVVWC